MRRNTTIIGIALGLMLAAATFAHAEGYAGFRGGLNLASFSGEPSPATGTRTGFTGGVFVGFHGEGRFGFRTDMLYTMKGGTEGDASIKVDYMEVGTLLVVRQSLSQTLGLRFFAGPVFGLFVNAEADNGPVDLDYGDIVEHFELSGTIGAELDVKAGPYFVLFETRYTQGSRVFEGETLDGSDLDWDVSNSGVAVMAGLMVPF